MSHLFLVMVAGGGTLLSMAGLHSQGRPGKDDLPGASGGTAEQIVRRLNENFEKSEDKLAKTDPREETQKLQKQIVKDLDELIKQRQNQKGTGGANDSSAPSSRPRSAGIKGEKNKEPSAKKNIGDNGQSGKHKGDGPNNEETKKHTVADLPRDPWGDLPKRLRQEMVIYGKQRFLPKYEELLRQYYRTIAESDRRTDD